MVQISICGGGQFQGTETNVIECFVVNAESFISVFYKLVNREGSVVGFDNSVTDLDKDQNKFHSKKITTVMIVFASH